MPGAVLDLLKLAVNRSVANEEPRLTTGSLLETLSQLTGLPRSILDDGERVELESIERFFTARVIGQPEAVRATIERIAMLKAGLTDPAKPIGIFLFAGPTGTGKTELARTLAEFLFGSVERMIRLDMSEFQTPDSTRKILGDGGAETQSLALRVRKQPFCLILLDEFEKSHSNIWDLFLQVFDAGRLTDAAGQTVDFRHSIIILTSNLGATRHLSSGLGFTPQANAFSHEQVLHAVAQNFRPEFVNRVDRVIVFRPLTRELMRGILQKELKNVLERRGLRNREWAVEWEPSALEFLLDKGFSPEMGARPLKRAIDQYLLAPLAATIVEHRAPAGEQFLFVRAAGDAIQVEFVDPDVEPEAAVTASANSAPVPASLPALILHPNGTAAEREALQRRLEETEARLTSSEWEARKQTLTIAMQDATFWDRPDRHEVLARYALMDRVRAATAGARSLERRLGRTTTHGGRSSRELVSRLALQLHLIALGIDDASSGAPVEVILSAQPALESGTDSQAARAWAEKLRAMYRRWGARRNMQVQEVMPGGSAGPMLLVLGFGAWRTLEKEVGLHVLEAENPPDGPGRAVARVKIAERPLDDSTSSRGSHGSLAALLDRTPPSHQVVRRYRLDGSPLVRDARQGWRTGRVDAVLAGDFDLLAQIADTPA
jgi:ATP-dependent Clp protease ATP-binding subunit ClpC